MVSGNTKKLSWSLRSTANRRELHVVSERWTVRMFISQFSRVFGISDFLCIKINQNYYFAGNESDDNLKDHEAIVIDMLV